MLHIPLKTIKLRLSLIFEGNIGTCVRHSCLTHESVTRRWHVSVNFLTSSTSPLASGHPRTQVLESPCDGGCPLVRASNCHYKLTDSIPVVLLAFQAEWLMEWQPYRVFKYIMCF